MTLETSKLLRIVQSLHNTLLELQVEGNGSLIPEQVAHDFRNLAFQRGYLIGLERVLHCEGIPAFLSGEEAQIITGHLNRIGMIFSISEKEAAHG